ncbi:PIN domain-containing protein [Sandaracinobacteroides saxicola]|uniref:Ribonuclease VapC n=1 Tax=Sandaracinobacteroides saxicola TaxID=2759707 RepID=A0A7G5IJF8_9SPHN|nr:PIN domain-containing protein [Sandaracinobacteroides saxicola]QMW23500.1 PIN domain-containing protein [Sandaracinobacteroides saxicola]
MILLDTGVAINLRDQHEPTRQRLRERSSDPRISIITQVELAAGLHRKDADERRAMRLAVLLRGVTVLPFTVAEAAVYARILAVAGFSRRKLLDRLIAATAVANEVPLATVNPDDFADVPDLEIEDWR